MTFKQGPLNTVHRLPKRGHYDHETIYRILDQSLICHVAFVQGNQPFIIPTLYARRGDEILLHGASTSRMLQHIQERHPVCIAVTVLNALVLARSVFNHSINYESVVLFGTGRVINEQRDKEDALLLFTEKVMPGRWDDARRPSAKEYKATSIVAVSIDTASAKVRTGDPKDDPEDMELPVWAGLVPMHTQWGEPIAAADLAGSQAIPDYLRQFIEAQNKDTHK